MVKYAFDARSSKIILTGADGDVFCDINNILATEDNPEGCLVILATGGANEALQVKEKTAEIVAFIKKLADEQMVMKEAEAKAREEAFIKAKAEEKKPA